MPHPTISTLSKISSIGFSGAGFLASYHLGVAQCLMDQGILQSTATTTTTTTTTATTSSCKNDTAGILPLTGVSAGALISTAIMAGVDLQQDGMQAVLDVSRQTRQHTYVDVLQPGFSLIDVMEVHFVRLFKEAVERQGGEDAFLKRIQHGKLLRIGLTDRRVFPPVGYNPQAFLYVDQYRSVQDVWAACILSSYIPGLTGPALGSKAFKNLAILRASKQIEEMVQAGCVKKACTGEPIQLESTKTNTCETQQEHNVRKKNEKARLTWTRGIDEWKEYYTNLTGREVFWDGGLVNAFPYIDEHTLIVSPMAATFSNDSISPAVEYCNDCSDIQQLQINPRVRLHLTTANARAFRHIGFSSEDSVLQAKFAQGYDNAHSYLNQRNLLSVYQQHFSQNLDRTSQVKMDSLLAGNDTTAQADPLRVKKEYHSLYFRMLLQNKL